MQRREFLGIAIASAGATMCPGGAAVLAQTPNRGLHATALRGGLYRLGGVGGNIVVLGAGDRIALVDSGAPQHGEAVATYLADRHAGAPVQLMFNTHWHPEHTGGNERLAAAGTPIIAHENTRLWMSTRFYVDWQAKTYRPRPAEARPTRTFHSSDPQPIEAELAGQTIEYGHLRQAHTDGDIYVRFPNLNVIAAGGAVTDKTYPILDYITGGWIGGLVDATEKLIEMSDSETLILPRAGAAQSRADLEAQRDMLMTVRERIETKALQGKSAEEMVAEGITSDFDERWSGDRQLFVSNAYEGLWWDRMRGVIA